MQNFFKKDEKECTEFEVTLTKSTYSTGADTKRIYFIKKEGEKFRVSDVSFYRVERNDRLSEGEAITFLNAIQMELIQLGASHEIALDKNVKK